MVSPQNTTGECAGAGGWRGEGAGRSEAQRADGLL